MQIAIIGPNATCIKAAWILKKGLDEIQNPGAYGGMSIRVFLSGPHPEQGFQDGEEPGRAGPFILSNDAVQFIGI